MLDSDLLNELDRWNRRGGSGAFPVDRVIAEYRRVGKHFVDRRLLEQLAERREALPSGQSDLNRLLATALDKFDGRFDNPSYLALHDLPLPTTSGRCPLDTVAAERQRDRLTALLIVDTLRFELDALDGRIEIMPLLRPSRRLVEKRCAIGVRILKSVLPRLDIDVAAAAADDPIDVARSLCAEIEGTHSGEDRRMLEATFLPVYVAHDEHMFIRMLQTYETTFALVAVEIRAAIVAIQAGLVARAVSALSTATQMLDNVSPCFSLVATMQPEAFLIFREFTDGASAIQSRTYKEIESLCRRPDESRLTGPGYDATPEVREKVRAGRTTLDDAASQAQLSPEDATSLRAAMDAFETEVFAWRRTHHNIATRMLGLKRGTGYTAGVSYLAEALDTPVFRCPFTRGNPGVA